jgi:hypothetical protein
MTDDTMISENIVPIWKLKLVESLEQAYDAYMSGNKDSLYENA